MRFAGLLVIALVLLASSDVFAQAKPQKTKPVEIAIFQLEANGVDKSVANVVTDALHAQLRKLPNSRIISSKEIETMLGYEERKQLAGCSQTSCVVAIGGAMGVDKILTGSVGKLGDSYIFNLKLLDIFSGKIEGMFDKRLSEGDEEDFLESIPEALETLFPQNALLWPKGSMDRKVKRAGPSPWVMVGVGGAAVITGGVLTYLANAQYSDWKKMRYDDPNINSVKSQITAKEISSYVLYGVGAGAIAGGLVWYFVTDYATDKKKAEKAKQKAEPKKTEIKFQPLMLGTYGGNLSVAW